MAINIDFLKTCGNNLKSLASNLQVVIRFHPGHPQPQTLVNSFSVAIVNENGPLCVCKVSRDTNILHRMKWCELREYKWNECVTIAVNRNLSNCEKARKRGFRGFNGIRTRGLCVSAAVLYQPELWRPIHWRPANLLSSSTRERNETQNEMMWTAGIQMKWVCDHRSESQFKQLRKSPKKSWFNLSWFDFGCSKRC